MTMTVDFADQVLIEEPEFYAAEPFELFARMRQEAPVFWYEPLETWVLTKYMDVRYVGRNPGLFTSTHGILLNDIKHDMVVDKFFMEGAELLSIIDPPRHLELRRCLAPSFTPPAIQRLEERIRGACRALLDTIVPGEPLPFVHQIAAVLPLQAIAMFMGLPDDNIAQLKYWTDERLKVGAALDKEGVLQAAANALDLEAYLDEWVVRHLGNEGHQLIPTLVRSKLKTGLTYENLHMFLSFAITAGNETTRDFLAASIFTYAHHPDQRRRLVEDPSMAADAVEECLRWVTPVRGFIRTVTQDLELRGQRLRPGEHVYMLWMASNRDEEIWDRADEFDIGRGHTPIHQAFGFGEHSCIGAPLARLEGRIFFEELVQRYSHWEIAGEPERPYSILHNSFEELPVVFYR
jgi:cytochrome P450